MSMRRTEKIVSKSQTVCSIDFAKRFHYTIVVATSDSSQALYEATGELIGRLGPPGSSRKPT